MVFLVRELINTILKQNYGRQWAMLVPNFVRGIEMYKNEVYLVICGSRGVITILKYNDVTKTWSYHASSEDFYIDI
jgi:hypothetical protein